MQFFKSKTKAEEKAKTPAIVFDFGTGSLKILLCVYSQSGMEVIDGTKIKYPPEVYASEDELRLEHMEPQIREKVKLMTERASMGRVTKAIIALGGLSVEGYSSKINYRRVHPENEITKIEFQNILARVEDRADQIMKKMIDWETASTDNIAPLSSEVLEMGVSGYITETPVGQKGEKITFVVYNSYTRSSILKAIENMVKSLGFVPVSAVSTIYAVSNILLESIGNKATAILDIGAGNTEVSVIEKGRILGHMAFDVGGESFTRSIADELDQALDDAETLKLGYAGGKLKPSEMSDVRQIVSSDCKVFLSGVKLILKEFPGMEGFPQNIILTGGGAVLPGIASGLQAEQWDELGGKAPRVELADPKKLPMLTDKTGKLSSPADVPTVAAALDAFDVMM